MPGGTRLNIGRYALFEAIASGGMATVHLGRLAGAGGFSRVVAIKRLHPHLADDLDFKTMFMTEAVLASRIRHPNVVPVLDVVAERDQLMLVMEYVEGESLSRVARAALDAGGGSPLPVLSAILSGVLRGLHAAHEARDENGEPLHLVHRDISPQNIMVGTDGIGHLLDFGIAKARNRVQTTRDGELKGKLAYMAPEQLNGGPVDRRVDVYAMGVVLWQVLTDEKPFTGETEGALVRNILNHDPEAPSTKARVPIPPALDAVAMRALERDAQDRFPTALMMAEALEAAVAPASPSEVVRWLRAHVEDRLESKAALVSSIERVESSPDLRAALDQSSLKSIDISFDAATITGSTLTPAPRSGEMPKHPRTRWVVYAGITIAAACVLGAIGFVLRAPATRPPTGLAGTSSAAAAAQQGAPATTLATSDAPAPATSASVAHLVSSALVGAPPPQKPANRPVTKPPASAAASASAGVSRPQPLGRCNPPYTFDADGNKIYKEECL